VAATLSPAQQAEIKGACERVALDYCFYSDNARTGDLAALFAEDGEFHLFGQVHVGPAGVAMGLGGRPETVVTVHAVSNHRIDVVSESEATSTAYVTVWVGDKSAPPPAAISPFLVGIYHDTYRKTAAGWRFARRVFEPLIAKAS
jgi:hypothetical protein